MTSAGSLDRLTLVEEELPAPGPGDVRVRVEAIGLNFADVFACLGLYSATPPGAFVPGLECAGVLESVPAAGAARGLRVGDRVMVLTRFGAYASALNVDARFVLPLPPGWTAADGAAYPVQALTAWYGLVQLGRLAPGEIVLVHSAAGGVGLHALAIAQSLGAIVIATVGRPEKGDVLLARGVAAERIIVREASRFGAQVDAALRTMSRTGLDVVFDAIAGPFFLPALTRLAHEGRHVLYGAADFMPSGARVNWARLAWQYVRRPRLDPMRLIDRNRSVLGFNLIWLFDKAERLPEAMPAVHALSPHRPHIGARFAFGDVPKALRALQSGTTTGKVVVQL
jgi:alcohol dehydrogenase